MSQKSRLLDLLRDCLPHRTDEILLKIYGSEHLGIARISARIKDLKNDGYSIKPSWADEKNPTLSWYQLEPLKTQEFDQTKGCCPSFVLFGTHNKDCPIMAELERTAKILEKETERNLRLI